jgi:hypothetical protein
MMAVSTRLIILLWSLVIVLYRTIEQCLCDHCKELRKETSRIV